MMIAEIVIIISSLGITGTGLSLLIKNHYEKKYQFLNDRLEFQKWITEQQDKYIRELSKKNDDY